MRVDLDPGYSGNIGQGRRSKVKVKCVFGHQHLFAIYLDLRSGFKVGVKVKGQGQGQRSMSGAQRSILGARLAECSKEQLCSSLK